MKENETKDISQELLKSLISLIPKYEQNEINKKIETLISKEKTPKQPQCQLEKNNQIKLSIANTPDPSIKNYDTLADGAHVDNPTKKENEIEIQKIEEKSNSVHISLTEENEEEDLIHENLNEKRKILKKGCKVILDDLDESLCGKKRNISSENKISNLKEDKSEEKRKRKNSFRVSKNKKINEKNNNINPIIKNRGESKKTKKTKTEKDILLNLVKRKGFMKVYKCLTMGQLNREKPLEKTIDDIINNIGLLKASLIILEIKFQEIEDIINKNINTNNIININSNSNSNNSNNISTEVHKDKDDIDIEINDISDCQDKNITPVK